MGSGKVKEAEDEARRKVAPPAGAESEEREMGLECGVDGQGVWVSLNLAAD